MNDEPLLIYGPLPPDPPVRGVLRANGGEVHLFGSGFWAHNADGDTEVFDNLRDATRHIRGLMLNPNHPLQKEEDDG